MILVNIPTNWHYFALIDFALVDRSLDFLAQLIFQIEFNFSSSLMYVTLMIQIGNISKHSYLLAPIKPMRDVGNFSLLSYHIILSLLNGLVLICISSFALFVCRLCIIFLTDSFAELVVYTELDQVEKL